MNIITKLFRQNNTNIDMHMSIIIIATKEFVFYWMSNIFPFIISFIDEENSLSDLTLETSFNR